MAVVTGIVSSSATASVSPYGLSYRLVVRDFRFRHDDGSETSASWASDLNTNLPDIDSSTNYRVRFSIENTGLSAATVPHDGHLEVSENSGAYKTMGMDANTSPVTIPPFTTSLVSSYSASDVGSDNAITFVDSTGTWHMAFSRYTASGFSIDGVVILSSINDGASWRRKDFDLPSEEIWTITEDNSGVVIVVTTSYLIKTSNSGLSWTAVSRPTISGGAFFTFFVSVNNDYIICEEYALKYHISADDGVTWTTYEDTDFPAALGIADIYYELDSTTGDLTVWYLGTTSWDDPVNMYRWIDTYPYSGFPNAAEDDVSQLLFTGTSSLTYTYGFYPAVFVRLADNLGMSAIMYSSGFGVEPAVCIVQIGETDTYEFKDIDYISQNWSDTTPATAPPDIKAMRYGRYGYPTYTSVAALGIAGTNSDRTPGFMGWFPHGITDVRNIVFSPSVNKWLAARTQVSGSVECYELSWSQVVSGTDTTQQLSSGTYTSPNGGFTNMNYVTGLSVGAGEFVELEYAFKLRPSEDVAGKTVCFRPSGFGSYDNVACFTIPVGYCSMQASATVTVNGDTDGPHSALTASATAAVSAEVVRNCQALTNCISSITVGATVSKYGSTAMLADANLQSLAWVQHAAICAMTTTASVDAISVNTRTAAAALSAIATSSWGEPELEKRCRVSMSVSSSVTPMAVKTLNAAAHLQSSARASFAADECKLDIGLYIYSKVKVVIGLAYTIWDSGTTVWDSGDTSWDESNVDVNASYDPITVIKPAGMTIKLDSANISISKPATTDLVITKKSAPRVYIYELY